MGRASLPAGPSRAGAPRAPLDQVVHGSRAAPRRLSSATRGASSSFASSCSPRSCSISDATPRRSGAAIWSLKSWSAAIATSRSRRSPRASARRLTSLSASAMLLCREARLEDLERGTQPTGGHPHVVDALDVAGVEHPLRVLGQLARSHRDDLRGRLRVGLSAVRSGIGLALAMAADSATGQYRRQTRSYAASCSARSVRRSPLSRVEDDPLAQAALADLQRLAEHLENFSSSSTPAGSSLTRRGVELEALRDLGDLVAGEHADRRAPASRTRARRRPGCAARSRCRRPRPPAPGAPAPTPSKKSEMWSRSPRISAADGGSDSR